jgi:hypothetical protein
VVDSRPEEMMASYPETSSSHRRQDQQDDIADTKSATTPRLLFNTFRSHLNPIKLRLKCLPQMIVTVKLARKRMI